MKTCDLVGWHYNLFFEHFDSLPPLDQACHLYIMSVISNYNCMQKDFLGHRGEHISKNIFLFPIHVSLIGEMVFSTNIYRLVLAQREKHFQG